jgi:hypothetical protein
MRPRSRAFAAALLTGLAACASGGSRQLRAADPAQAVEDAPNAARAEVDRVVLRATLGGWRGQPRDLELRLTSVDVTIVNGLDRRLRIGPEAFTLVTASGQRLRVLTQDEVSTALGDLAGFRPRPSPRAGAVGGPTFPGYDSPSPHGPGSRSPANAPVPPAAQWYDAQLPSGTLEAGGGTSLLLFFDTPARSIASATFEVELVDAAGTTVATVRLPFARR